MRKTTFLTKISEIETIINKCDICHIAMSDSKGIPYLIPFNFGYKKEVLYFHSHKEGKKMDILKQNPNVCINFTTDHELFKQNEKVACSYGMRYRSVLINGKAEFINSYDEKVKAMNIFMKQYVDKDFSYSKPAINNVCMFKVNICDFVGKIYGHETLE